MKTSLKNHNKIFYREDSFYRKEGVKIPAKEFYDLIDKIIEEREENRRHYGYTAYVYDAYGEACMRLGV